LLSERDRLKKELDKLRAEIAVQDRTIKQKKNFPGKVDDEHKRMREEKDKMLLDIKEASE
jgi:hypothetical protein